MNLLEVAVLLVVLLGVVLLHGCILLGLGSWEDVVSSLWRRKTPPRTVASAPAGSGKRAKRTQRKKVLRQWRKSVDENEAQSLQPEMKLDRPCERCGRTNAKRNCSYKCCATCCYLAKNMCHGHGTEQSGAISLVERATRHSFRMFDLSYAHLKKCPAGITDIGIQLNSLNLSNNQLTSLPEDIGRLVNLVEFFLQYNCLTFLPESICKLTRLLELDVKNNALKSLPDAIGNLKRLQVLTLTNNHLSHLPDSIGGLRQLEELSIHSNNLCKLPDQICRAMKLRIVYAGENNFQTLPRNFGRLERLEELDVSGNALEYLPESLSECKSLQRLWLSNNRLSTLPIHIGRLSKLKELHVRNNVIKYFPSSIQKLQLYTFSAQNNSFIQESAAKNYVKYPSQTFPPLLELAARAVVNMKVPITHGSIPHHLEVILDSPLQCTQCGEHLFQHYSAHFAHKTVGVFYRVPLYHTLCLPCNHSAANHDQFH